VTKAYTLTLHCADRIGLVADVSGFLRAQDANIIDAQQYHDPSNGRFFMRVEFETEAAHSTDTLNHAFKELATNEAMSWNLRAHSDKTKVLLMASNSHHCLGDLLYRWRLGELDMDVVGIVSNHPNQALTEGLVADVPFHHLPITKETKPQQEAQVKAIIEKTGAELVVLARYMQILSDDMTSYLSGRCINIHHSFLPGFKGAKPYHQAYKRGVKMIGATAHYVTADLDEGPIIHQDVETITHFDTPKDMIRKGRDIERQVLATAVRHQLQGRIFLNGERTVVFKA